MIVVWQITQRCNFSCPFCLYDKRRSFPRRDADAAAVLRFAKLLGEYKMRQQNRVLISWLGGEPFLWKPMFAISRKLREDYGLEFSTTTNGSLLSADQIQDQVLTCFSELTVSVDGFADLHNQLRGKINGWRQLSNSIRLLSRKAKDRGVNLKLRVNSVLMHDNISVFPDLCRELAGWGIQEITFNQLGGRDRPEFFPEHRLRSEEVEQLILQLPSLREELRSQGVLLCGNEQYWQRILRSSRDENIAIDNCQPGEDFLFIDEAGRIAPCSYTAESLGKNISELQNVHDIANLPMDFSVEKTAKTPKSCSNCTSTRVFAKFSSG